MNVQPEAVIVLGRDRLVTIDLQVYGLESVLKCAYQFTGKAYVHLEKSGDSLVSLRMRPKRAAADGDAMVREFLNELLDQRLRALVAIETQKTRDLLMAHALSRANFIRPDFESALPAAVSRHVTTRNQFHSP